MIIAEDTRLFLNGLLKLPVNGQEQDWELELADADRIEEFIDVYEKEKLEHDARLALFALIASSYEDYCQIRGQNSYYEKSIKDAYRRDEDLLREVIDYWAVLDQNSEDDCFCITQFMRSLKI